MVDAVSSDEAGYYGSPYNDHYLLHDPANLPRYGYLARKVLMHYAGDAYNPHLHGLMHEPFLRGMIKEIIAYKVLYRVEHYDWEWIDHSFRSMSRNVSVCHWLTASRE